MGTPERALMLRSVPSQATRGFHGSRFGHSSSRQVRCRNPGGNDLTCITESLRRMGGKN